MDDPRDAAFRLLDVADTRREGGRSFGSGCRRSFGPGWSKSLCRFVLTPTRAAEFMAGVRFAMLPLGVRVGITSDCVPMPPSTGFPAVREYSCFAIVFTLQNHLVLAYGHPTRARRYRPPARRLR